MQSAPDFSDSMTQLEQGLCALGLTVPTGVSCCLMAFLDLLEKWAKCHNLTAIRDRGHMLTHHLLDSASMAPYVAGSSIVDVGSGAGFPGIPLALLFPDKRFTLVESRSKKTSFLLQAIAALQIKNVSVLSSRVESAQLSDAPDMMICRAFGTIAHMIACTRSLLPLQGRWLIMKGVYPETELRGVSYSIVVHRVRVPFLSAERHIVEILNREATLLDRALKHEGS